MRRKIFSLYVVMDMSESMSWKDSTGEAKIRTAMEIVPGIIEIAEKNTSVAAALRVSVIGFNQTASEIFEPSLPLVDRGGGTVKRAYIGIVQGRRIFRLCLNN